ncbi:MAG: transglutaminase-like domain-containing protein [Lachnospiraceae bacterium]|nr:transglutaminase-like domain-containing protein [Lachnospiraceae bacterium]
MKRLGLIFCIYFSIIYGVCTGFKIENYRGFVFILAFFFFLYWSIITSDFFYGHRLLRWIQYVQYTVLAGYILFDARRLLAGGIALCNRLFDVLNTTFHREFTYFSGVNEETAQADILIFTAILLLLYSGILLLSRRHIWLLVMESMPVMILLMIFTPQAIHGDFFVYFAGIVGLYYLEHFKIKTAVISFSILIFGALFFLFYPSTELFGQDMTSIRQGSMFLAEYISHVINGERSVFTLNFGDIKNEATKKHESSTKFSLRMKRSENAVYLRSYIGQEYENGKWRSNKKALDSAGLLEDYENILNTRLKDVPNYRPSVRSMQIIYGSEDAARLYPYYTISVDGEDGTIEYLSVKDFDQFLENADLIVDTNEQDGTYDWNRKSQIYNSVSKENLSVPSKLEKECKNLISDFTKENTSDVQIISRIKKYLDQNFTFTSNAGAAPEAEDPMEYFLFQSKRGNISEYASASVLLFRSCKIPARYVEGYLLKEEDFYNAAVTDGKMTLSVDDDNAYAWAEVYIRGIGWIPVNPVSGDALIAASDAREIELPSLPKLTMSPGELMKSIMKVFAFGIWICMIRVVLIHYVVYKRKQKMTRAERIRWYSRIWNRYKYQHFDMRVQNIIERAEYSDHEITEDEETEVYEAAYLVRQDYRSSLPFYMNIYDVFLACRDVL